MSCAAAALLERLGGCAAAAHPLEEAHRRRGGDVETLGAPRMRNPHSVIGTVQELGRQAVGLIAEQERG